MSCIDIMCDLQQMARGSGNQTLYLVSRIARRIWIALVLGLDLR